MAMATTTMTQTQTQTQTQNMMMKIMILKSSGYELICHRLATHMLLGEPGVYYTHL
jgi:hypothetical protein